MKTPFKVCGIQSTDEVDMAMRVGAWAIGLVAEMPSGPGSISDALIRDIADFTRKTYSGNVYSVLLTSRTNGGDIADHISATQPDIVQFVDNPESGAYAVLRQRHPLVKIMQVVHVENEGAVDRARTVEAYVDFILLDSGKPSAPARTLGGTGDVHDWVISRKIIETVDCPVFLAGGLNPANVADAISSVRPFGVDICSGLRDCDRNYALVPETAGAFADAVALI